MPRKSITEKDQEKVLVRSRRRCCLCWGLHNDDSVKRGQIAHIDRNPQNNRASNLVWLCQNHHDEYDRISNQTKNITKIEIQRYKHELSSHIHHLRSEKQLDDNSFVAEKIQDEQILRTLSLYDDADPENMQIVWQPINSRIRRMIDYNNDLMDEPKCIKEFDIDKEPIEKFEQIYTEWRSNIAKSYGIPDEIESIDVEENQVIDDDWKTFLEMMVADWVIGTATYQDCLALHDEIEEQCGLDFTYIMYGFPVNILTKLQNICLRSHFYRYGPRNEYKSPFRIISEVPEVLADGKPSEDEKELPF